MRVRFVSLMVFCLTLSAGAVFAQQIPAQLAPDTIYFNGKIVTVDKPFTIAQAFAVKGEHFVAIGNNADIRALAGRNTQLVDLTGHTVIPGLMDNHNHMIWHARDIHRGIDMINVPSLAEMMNRLRAAVAKAKPGEVIVASGDGIGLIFRRSAAQPRKISTMWRQTIRSSCSNRAATTRT